MIVVVGGHSRNIGKTSVVCGIISALPDWNWTALKITQYGHGQCARDGAECDCAGTDHPVAFSEEKHAGSEHDSPRYLAAGAARSFWLRTPQGRLAEAMPQLRRALATSENVIIESNSVRGLLRPDLFFVVLDAAVADFKPSTQRYLDLADGLVLTSSSAPAWQSVSSSLLAGKPRYDAPPPAYANAALVSRIREAKVLA